MNLATNIEHCAEWSAEAFLLIGAARHELFAEAKIRYPCARKIPAARSPEQALVGIFYVKLG